MDGPAVPVDDVCWIILREEKTLAFSSLCVCPGVNGIVFQLHLMLEQRDSLDKAAENNSQNRTMDVHV